MVDRSAKFEFSTEINLGGSPLISDADSQRQAVTAAHLLTRLNHQPGVILADEVGLGKTFVALAVAASVAKSTRMRRPVIVMVPPALTQKWPQEWRTFAEYCLPHDTKLRATTHTIERPAEFLRLFDDDAQSRTHIAFVAHGALTRQLADPFTKLAIIKAAYSRSSRLTDSRRRFPRWGRSLLSGTQVSRYLTQEVIDSLLNAPLDRWLGVLQKSHGDLEIADDPVYLGLTHMIQTSGVDLGPLRDVLANVPYKQNATIKSRLVTLRHSLNQEIQEVWSTILAHAPISSPLLVMDEAHHVRHHGKIAGLFQSSEESSSSHSALEAGALAGKFDHMLFLTATPFQLGHRELINVLSRFDGVHWPNVHFRRDFDATLQRIATTLDSFQASAQRTQKLWAGLKTTDVASLPNDWWNPDYPLNEIGQENSKVIGVRAAIADLEHKTTVAEAELRPWVVRHIRIDRSERRNQQPGDSIRESGDPNMGLAITSESILPFLLAARARSLAIDKRLGSTQARAYFAEGLASSFEAYKDTRKNREAADGALISLIDSNQDPSLTWYLDWVERTMPGHTPHATSVHPKVRATVERTMDVWRRGEKVLIFCFYRETGRTLRREISAAMERELFATAASHLDLDPRATEAIADRIDKTSENILSTDSVPRRELEQRLHQMGISAGLSEDEITAFVGAVLRYIRTTSFLVRYVLPHGTGTRALFPALEQPDANGRSMFNRLESFVTRLAQLSESQRINALNALNHIQTGQYMTQDELEGESSTTMILPNVRLANGSVKAATRNILVSAFNMPFFPEVLVSSSVLSEGVDLHWECKTVIHHDLDWNPSTLEQRTGRLDRIGSMATALGKPIDVFEPYTSGLQDEKMFKVVMDRAQWFNIVMGDSVELNEQVIDGISERVPMPESLRERLTLNLAVAH